MAAVAVAASSGGGGGLGVPKIQYEWDKRTSKHTSCIEQVVWHRETIQSIGVALEIESGDDVLSVERKHVKHLETAVGSLKRIEMDLRLQQTACSKAHRLIDSANLGDAASIEAVSKFPVSADGVTRDWAKILSDLSEAERTAEYEAETKRSIAQTISEFRRAVHDVHHRGQPVPGEEQVT